MPQQGSRPVPSPPPRAPLRGSDKAPLPGATRVGEVPDGETLSVTVLIRRRPEAAGAPSPLERVRAGQPPLARDEFAATLGADPDDLDRVVTFARQQGLTVEASDAARRTVALSGTAGQFGSAFGVRLGRYTHDGGSYRGREGGLVVPTALAGIVEGVFGLDDRPAARPHLRLGAAAPEPGTPAAGAPGAVPYLPTDVARLYHFPTGVDVSTETVAIIELGGGYQASELAAYFAKLGVTPPAVTDVGVDGGANTPGGDADGEVLLDIEVVGAVAPGVNVAVYFGANTDRGFIDAVTTAIHDQTRRPSVVSISWGAPESAWTAQSMAAFDSAFADAAALGVTVLVAAGDHGAGDGAGDTLAHADFPASSPHVTGCGGTTLRSAETAITSEVTWNDGNGWATGGGVSDVFDLPDFQRKAGVPPSVNPAGAAVDGTARVGRGVPDIAGNADSVTGYTCLVDGQWTTIGGTSAVAPLYAGLVALLNASLGRPVGFLNPVLYALGGSPAIRDVTEGDNSVPKSDYGPAVTGYQAGAGWDAVTGLGSLDGTALLTALAAGPHLE